MMNGASIDQQFSLEKIRNLIAASDQIIFGAFPYDDARLALVRIRDHFKEIQDELAEIDAGARETVILQACRDANSKIVLYEKFLGLILRSSNIRNAFEAYSAVKVLATQLLDKTIKIIISSEWNFSPFVYPLPSPVLTEFVLVGLPASESGNSLILPLAGHELGHALWRRRMRTNFSKDIENEVILVSKQRWADVDRIFQTKVPADDIETNIIARTIWSKPYAYALRQVEEVFCDAVGCWLFGEGYLHAFRYLLAPNPGTRRSEYYPAIHARARYIASAAEKYHYKVPSDYLRFFYETDSKRPRDEEILLKIADDVTEKFVDRIIQRVDNYCRTEKCISPPTEDGSENVYERFLKIAPADEISHPGDVINAAWKIRLDLGKWPVRGAEDSRKLYILNDLVFKTLEVSEFNRLVGAYHARQQRPR